MTAMYIVLGVIGSVLVLWFIGGFFRHRKDRNRLLNVIKENCTGCQRCMKRCRRKALSIVDKKIVLDPMRCSACGDCVSVCKFNALQMVVRKN